MRKVFSAAALSIICCQPSQADTLQSLFKSSLGELHSSSLQLQQQDIPLAIAQSNSIQVSVENIEYTFSSMKQNVTASGNRIWLGQTDAYQSLSLIQSDYGLSGHLRVNGQVWNLIKHHENDYEFVLNSEIAEREQSSELDVLDSRNLPKEKSSNAQSSSGQQSSLERHKSYGFEQENQINVLVYYSSEAKSKHPDIEALIELEFAETNAAFEASEIDINLVKTAVIEVNDANQDDNLFDMLSAQGAYQNLPNLRNRYQADLVHFFGGRIGFVCGKAWYSVDESGWSDEVYGLGSTSDSCFGNLTFAHEIGHNLAAKHDRYVEDGGNDYFNYGFVDTENKKQTIMSYNDRCNDEVGFCDTIPYFSNPRVLDGDAAVGIERTDPESADNSLMMNQSANIVANFRGAGAPTNIQVSKTDTPRELKVSWDEFPNADAFELEARWHSNEECRFDRFSTNYTFTPEISDNSALITIPSSRVANLCISVAAKKSYEWVDDQQVEIKSLYSLPAIINLAESSANNIALPTVFESTSAETVLTVDFIIENADNPSVSIVDQGNYNEFSVTLAPLENDQFQLVIENQNSTNGFAQVQVRNADEVKQIWIVAEGFVNQAPMIEVQENAVLQQLQSVEIPLKIIDESRIDLIEVSALSNDETLINPDAIAYENGVITIKSTSELFGETSISVVVFDGELTTTKDVNISVERSIYNEPIVPEQVNVFVKPRQTLLRELPGEDIDGDDLVYEVVKAPSFGEFSLMEHTFNYSPNNDFESDQLELSVKDVSSEQTHTVLINILPLPRQELPYQQKLSSIQGRTLFLSHRGDLYEWGNSIDNVIYSQPHLRSSGWVDFDLNQSALYLLKADGSLWFEGQEGQLFSDGGNDIIGPVQIGTDNDWVDLQDSDTFSSATLALKADGSIWALGNYLSTENLPAHKQSLPYTPLNVVQLNGLYNWKGGKFDEVSAFFDNEGKVWTSGTPRFSSLARPLRNSFLSPIDFDVPVEDMFFSLWRMFVDTQDGIYGLGSNNFMQDSITQEERNELGYYPLTLSNTQNWKVKSYATYGFIGIDQENKLWTSATQSAPRLGRGASPIRRLTSVTSDNLWATAYATREANYAVDATGQMWVAGRTDYVDYELGLGEPPITSTDEFLPIEGLPISSTGVTDSDEDGILDYLDPDDDNDGVVDSVDANPDDPNIRRDNDLDGIDDSVDPDDDNDGVPDTEDMFPFDASEWLDTDLDGIGNNADEDDDGDGYIDTDDAFPLDASEWVDTDLDGVGNNADTDDDNDTYLDQDDAFPLNPNEWLDTDLDGTGNNEDSDDDNDGVADANDAFPLDATETEDFDGDGIGNNADNDDDNDGVDDTSDAFPYNAAETTDSDGDGIGNNADSDDDNDGVPDSSDAFPLDSSRTERPTPTSTESGSGGGSTSPMLLLGLLALLFLRRRFA